MPAEYFEARERALLGERYDNALRRPAGDSGPRRDRLCPPHYAGRICGPGRSPLRPSPFCKAAFVVEQPDFKPGRHPTITQRLLLAGASASSAAPLLGVRPGMRVLDLCAAPGGKEQPARRRSAGAGPAGEQRICRGPCRDPEEQPRADGCVQRRRAQRNTCPHRSGPAGVLRPGSGGRALLR